MSTIAKGLAVLLSAAVLWGCSGTKEAETGAEETAAATTGAEQASSDAAATMAAQPAGDINAAEIQGLGAGQMIEADPFNDPNNLLSTTTVYFDYDQSTIKSDARTVIDAHARYLSENPNVRVTLEGHCDERGTREYNLGLGERRAKAVQQLMSLSGVSNNQLEMVSYGEEKPAAYGHDDSAWSKNRRVEIIYSR